MTESMRHIQYESVFCIIYVHESCPLDWSTKNV